MSLDTLTFGSNGERLDRIAPSSLAYLSERARNTCYDYVLDRFFRSGMTKAELARRIGKTPDQINHMLASPGNWTIKTMAELLAAIADEEFIPKSRLLRGRAPQNMAQEDLQPPQSANETGSSAKPLEFKIEKLNREPVDA